MGRIAGGAVALLLVVAALFGIWLYQQVSTLHVTRVTDDLHMIDGLGSNVAVLRTDEGSIVVDTMTFLLQGREIRERAEALAGPVRAVVNTHYHLDHTHGNPAFSSGQDVYATARTRAYLDALDADYWQGDAAGTLPDRLFDDEHEIRLGGKTVRLFHPGRGHTDGDLVVLFVEDRTVHTGDLFFNGRYPNIDLEAGGSVQEWSATLDRVLELDFDRVIPGHGPLTDREGLVAFQRFMQELAAVGRAAEREDASLDETLASADLRQDEGYEVMAIPLVMRLDRDFVVRRAWEEVTGNYDRVKLPQAQEEGR
jgi:glyoxylase-like metal-dependent hydrolase (beta-lactamase superfamily II)